MGAPSFLLIFSCAQNLSLQGKAHVIFNKQKKNPDGLNPSEASE